VTLFDRLLESGGEPIALRNLQPNQRIGETEIKPGWISRVIS
jgi:hypothetical protein